MAGRWHWLFVLCCRCVVWAAQMVQRGVHCLVDHRLALFRVLAVRHPFGADPLGRIAQSFHRCAMYCSRFRTPVSHHHLHGPVLKKSLPMLYLGGVDSSHSPECD